MSEDPSPATGEGAPDRGGKNVVDFERDTIVNSLRKAVRLLPPGKRRLLFAAAGIQVSLGLLDLLGIALVGILAAVAVSGTGISMVPAPVQTVLDTLGLGDLTITQLSAVVAVSAVTVLVAKTALSAVMQRRIFQFLANRQAEVSARLARAFLSRPLMDVQRWTEPEAIYALGSGVGAATVSLLGAAIIIASEIFLFAIVAVTLFLLDPVITFVAIAMFATLGLVMQRVLTRRTTRNAQVMTDASIDTLAAVSEALQTYREATVLNRRDLYLARYERLIGQYAGATASTAFIMEIPKYVLESALYLGILVLAGVQFITKDFAAAAATTALFLAAGTRVTPALLRLQGAGITIRNASVQAQPTFYLADFLGIQMSTAADDRATPAPAATAIRARIAAGHGDFDATVDVRDASVTYLSAAEPALINATFHAPAGSSVALVGSTGAGKSTLADVVLGVLEPATGSVTIGGVSPREAISRWPGAIAYVPQQVALVFGTVRENVALGLPREAIDDDMVWEALERSYLADFLRESREGLETTIGERGVRLSGGQRQRLGIARALYTRPRLLVLDEATSALDAETEVAIIKTLDALEGEVTTMTIAHRLATVRRADQLLYLEGGRIISSGTFDEVRNNVAGFDRQASLLGL